MKICFEKLKNFGKAKAFIMHGLWCRAMMMLWQGVMILFPQKNYFISDPDSFRNTYFNPLTALLEYLNILLGY